MSEKTPAQTKLHFSTGHLSAQQNVPQDCMPQSHGGGRAVVMIGARHGRYGGRGDIVRRPTAREGWTRVHGQICFAAVQGMRRQLHLKQDCESQCSCLLLRCSPGTGLQDLQFFNRSAALHSRKLGTWSFKVPQHPA